MGGAFVIMLKPTQLAGMKEDEVQYEVVQLEVFTDYSVTYDHPTHLKGRESVINGTLGSLFRTARKMSQWNVSGTNRMRNAPKCAKYADNPHGNLGPAQYTFPASC
jgi:hypothetical protein